MSKNKKMNHMTSTILTVFIVGFYILYTVCLFWYHPFVVSAEETAKEGAIPGGSGNMVSVYSEYSADGSSKSVNAFTVELKEGYELLAVVASMGSGQYYILDFKVIDLSNRQVSALNEAHLADYTGYTAHYKNGELQSSNPRDYPSTGSYVNLGMVFYRSGSGELKGRCDSAGFKIFQNADALSAYVKSGSLDGLANPSIDMGLLDKDIGYLHDLTYEPLQYGETDENGVPESFDDCFTWSDFYSEYDDTYLVEVRASCAVETKKWFGLSKGTVYNSDIRNIANGIRYKDLEFTISIADERSVFADFINEHMPDENSLKSFGAVGGYHFDTYYFRIYKWDEKLKSYRYGQWVRLTKDGTALMGSLNNNTDAGYFDKNGNWITDIDSSYGEGKPGTAIVGSGNTKDDAKEDADSKKDKIESGDNKIDLSNTNFAELWEWFCKCLISFWNGIGVIPEFFGRMFSFLPSPVIGFIGLGIVAAIILRVLGR